MLVAFAPKVCRCERAAASPRFSIQATCTRAHRAHLFFFRIAPPSSLLSSHLWLLTPLLTPLWGAVGFPPRRSLDPRNPQVEAGPLAVQPFWLGVVRLVQGFPCECLYQIYLLTNISPEVDTSPFLEDLVLYARQPAVLWINYFELAFLWSHSQSLLSLLSIAVDYCIEWCQMVISWEGNSLWFRL